MTWEPESFSYKSQRMNGISTLRYQSADPGMVILHNVHCQLSLSAVQWCLAVGLLWQKVESVLPVVLMLQTLEKSVALGAI